jgi:hypothetical protein
MLTRRRPARRCVNDAGRRPQAWLADVLTRLPDHPAKRIHELLPWSWHRQYIAADAA